MARPKLSEELRTRRDKFQNSAQAATKNTYDEFLALKKTFDTAEYNVLGYLDERSLAVVGHCLAQFGRNKRAISSVADSAWDVSIEDIVHMFGPSGINSVDLTTQLRLMANELCNNTSWDDARAEMELARERRREGLDRPGRVSSSRDWAPYDIKKAHERLREKLAEVNKLPQFYSHINDRQDRQMANERTHSTTNRIMRNRPSHRP